MLVERLRSAFVSGPAAWASACLFIFSLSLYSGMLGHGFVWDDEGVITSAPEIHDFANIPTFFVRPLQLGEAEQPGSADDPRIRYYRPLLTTLHTVEYHFFGANPLGYKLVNLVLNGAVVVLAFLLVLALTQELAIGFLAGLLYAANPVRAEVVYWVYSDSHLLAALFSLLVLLAYHHRRTVFATCAMATGLLFQEGVVLVTGALVLYQATLAPERGAGWRRLAPLLILATGYLTLRRQVVGALPIADLDILERLRASAYLLLKHLQLSVVTDAPVTMYRNVPGMFGAGGVATPLTLLGALLLLALGVWLWWRQRRWFFWCGWFLVWISLAFNLGSYADYLLAEKSLYLATLGPSVLLARVALHSKRWQTLGVVLLVGLIQYQAWTTVSRGRYWTDTPTYLEKLLEFEPAYQVGRYQLGVEYLKTGRYADAIRQLDGLTGIRPSARQKVIDVQTDAYEQWGRSLAERGDLNGALAAFQSAKQLSPERSSVYNGLGIVYSMRGERNQAVAAWETAVGLDPGNNEARANLEHLGRPNKSQ